MASKCACCDGDIDVSFPDGHAGRRCTMRDVILLSRICLWCFNDARKMRRDEVEGLVALMVRRIKTKDFKPAKRSLECSISDQRLVELSCALHRGLYEDMCDRDWRHMSRLKRTGWSSLDLPAARWRRLRRKVGVKGRLCKRLSHWEFVNQSDGWQRHHHFQREYKRIALLTDVNTSVSSALAEHCEFKHSNLLPTLKFRLSAYKRRKQQRIEFEKQKFQSSNHALHC